MDLSNFKHGSSGDITNKIGQWYSRNRKGVYYDEKRGGVVVKRGKDAPTFYKGSLEVKFPKNYLINKDRIQIEYSGYGWFSVKLIEATLGDGGIKLTRKDGYKKPQTVREMEVFELFRGDRKTVSFKISHMYNKPFNVRPEAFMRGLQKIDKSKVVSCEITVRVGKFLFYEIDFE